MIATIALGLIVVCVLVYLAFVPPDHRAPVVAPEFLPSPWANSGTSPSIIAAQALADLGPVLAGESDLQHTAAAALSVAMSLARVSSGALFCLRENPPVLASMAAAGFDSFPRAAVFPLEPRQVYALTHACGPQRLSGVCRDLLLGSDGNISSTQFRILLPLRVLGKLAGVLMLGEPEGADDYSADALHQTGELSAFIALAVHNHQLSMALQERTLRHRNLIASVHPPWNDAIEAFATTIDAKNDHERGHSLRVGRYAAGIAETLGMDTAGVNDVRAAGYLHDIGKVVVDKSIFDKTSTLSPHELQEMINHTLAGHQIVSEVQFPWPKIPEVVRSHHERADGSGYPDHLRHDEVSTTVKIVAVADTFDAMLSDRPYRKKMSLGEAAAHISHLAHSKLDADSVQALMIQLRRDAVNPVPIKTPPLTNGKEVRKSFLGPEIAVNISPMDIDDLLAKMNRRLSHGRAFVF
jgi:putative nucleotidyltransferase with HDIG domain